MEAARWEEEGKRQRSGWIEKVWKRRQVVKEK